METRAQGRNGSDGDYQLLSQQRSELQHTRPQVDCKLKWKNQTSTRGPVACRTFEEQSRSRLQVPAAAQTLAPAHAALQSVPVGPCSKGLLTLQDAQLQPRHQTAALATGGARPCLPPLSWHIRLYFSKRSSAQSSSWLCFLVIVYLDFPTRIVVLLYFPSSLKSQTTHAAAAAPSPLQFPAHTYLLPVL